MLEVSLLGEITFRLRGEPLSGFRSQKEIALLAYLAHGGHAANREALADLLWEARSTKQSLSNLRTALARLRKQIGDELVVTRRTVAASPAVHDQTDSVRLQALLAGAGTEERSIVAVKQLERGLELYRGEFMAGFALMDAPRFNDWLVVEQERLRQIAMRAFRRLSGLQEEQGAYAAGVTTAQQWAALDPLDEAALQQLMRLLCFDGRIAEAVAVFDRGRRLLEEELGVPPAPSTTALYQTIAEGALLPPTAEPLTLHNLPRLLTPLFGRKKETADLVSNLTGADYPLISITGAGGMGKTSLALAAGRRLLETDHPFPDGIWFVPLEDIEDETAEKVRAKTAALVGEAMGLHFHGESELWTQLLRQIAAKETLLILDNIEQFITAAAGLIVDLLHAGEGIKVLVTSRTTPALTAGFAIHLQGLQTPRQVSAAALENDCVRLFAERAARLPVPFDLRRNLAEVVAICRFVEGMPLGIELAAASLGRLTAAEIMPALRGNLQLISTNRLDLPPRQRTFHAVFDYTWQLLDPGEQAVLAQIAVFRGGFTRQAAEAVLGSDNLHLYRLLDHGVLSRNEFGRFRMHPLLRQLAREKLGRHGLAETEAETLWRHSRYFCRLLHSFEDALRRGLAQEALETLLPEQANLRAAWQHAVEAGMWPSIAEGLDGIGYFYERQGMFVDEAALADSALAKLLETGEGETHSRLRGRLLAVRARVYLHAARFEEALQSAQAATEAAVTLQDAGLEALARSVWANILSTQHRREEALAQYERVVALAQNAHEEMLEADGWIGIAAQLLWRADTSAAAEPLQRALALCRRLSYRPGELQTTILLANLASRSEDHALSIFYDQQALQLARTLGDTAAEAEALGSLSVRLGSEYDLQGAQSEGQKALTIFRRLNMPESEQWILGQLGYWAILRGDYAAAENVLRQVLASAVELDDVFWQAWVKLRLGAMYSESGQAEAGLPYFVEAMRTAEKFDYLNFQAGVLIGWGEALLNLSDWQQAQQKFQTAYDLRQGSGRTEQALPALAGLAYAAYRQGREEEAAALAERLWQTWQDNPDMARRANLKLYWLLGMVWEGVQDGRADALWDSAAVLLQERLQKLPDQTARQMFVDQVAAHRAISSIRPIQYG